MKKKIISVVGLICCLVLVGIGAQAGKEDFYEDEPYSAPHSEEQAEHEYHEFINLQPDSVLESESAQMFQEGEQEICDNQPNMAPISEAVMNDSEVHEYREE